MDNNLEKTCGMIYKLACEVNEALYYQYHASMEEQYQSAFSYELKKKKYVFHSETVIQLLYKDPSKETEADYFLLPGGPNKFEENIVIEVKTSKQVMQTKAEITVIQFFILSRRTIEQQSIDERYSIWKLPMWPTQSNPIMSRHGKFKRIAKTGSNTDYEL